MRTDPGDSRTPNTLWIADYKGQFRQVIASNADPLTITDYRSRYLLVCEGLESTWETGVFQVFELAFRELGLPVAMHSLLKLPMSTE